MRTVAEIKADIDKVRAEMQDVHGTTTEVYARIVGYYRSVRNWNRGKREEYNHRKLFVPGTESVQRHLASACDCVSQQVVRDTIAATPEGSVARYELFVRDTCPNCPPVKDCCTALPLSGAQINVDSAEGLERAAELGILSAPTVVFFDHSGNEIARAHSVKEIRSMTTLRHAVAEPALF